ncbi:putative ATPase [Catenulispora sp. EB89]|uniref:AAA family ATPase n=1 Tax=Catenulispora sp. EB89 TaxID=3156257 RepID=UPI003512A2BD
MAEDSLVAGFMLGGYRGFFKPQRISPLAKFSLIAGLNNSGKSNILAGAERWLPYLSAAADRGVSLDSLDRPMVPEGHPIPPLVFGIALKVEDPTVSLRNALPRNVKLQLPPPSPSPRGSQTTLEKLAFAPALRSGEDELIWFEWELVDSKIVRRPTQITALAEHLNAAGCANDLAMLSERYYSVTNPNIESHISRFLDSWQASIEVPPVVFIPAIRSIKQHASPTDDRRLSMDGSNLPAVLQAWQAPSAHMHREGRAKFQKLNALLKNVLEADDAELTVPYNAQTVHLSIDDRVLPLERLGGAISQIVVVAAVATEYTDCLICIEEPETNTHPTLLRKLIDYLRRETSNQYLVSTHSAHMIDDPEISVVRVQHDSANGTQVSAAITSSQRAIISEHLGFRASDLIQANSIIWVEGPSDRIYINAWLHQLDPELKEGVHYSVIIYGGRILSHLSATDGDESTEPVDDFILLPKINRHMAIAVDSDRTNAHDPINSTKERIIAEFENRGYAWVTQGREIENYVPANVLHQAAASVHSETAVGAPSGDAFGKRFEEMGLPNPRKVRIAEEAVKSLNGEVWDVLDLQQRVTELALHIRKWNGLDTRRDGSGAVAWRGVEVTAL